MNKIVNRCGWCESDPTYIHYHDTEWGVPLFNDGKLFEFLVLEGMQAGLSWLMVLKKRENFRKAFDNFNAEKIVKYNEKKFAELMNNAGIIRNQQKIRATIKNAGAFLKIQDEFGSFSDYIWKFVDGKPVVNKWKTLKQLPAKTPLSDKVSKELKARGFSFVGSTVVYAHMQATGMVNDHLVTCFRYGNIRSS